MTRDLDWHLLEELLSDSRTRANAWIVSERQPPSRKTFRGSTVRYHLVGRDGRKFEHEEDADQRQFVRLLQERGLTVPRDWLYPRGEEGR